jgi:hypothetical protein
MGDHAAKEEKVVSILNYRKSPNYVKDYMEQLYIDLMSWKIFKYQVAKNKKNNSYPANFMRLPGGDVYCGRIYCGLNPELYGRKVKNLKVINIDTDSEDLIWEEIDLPEIVRALIEPFQSV